MKDQSLALARRIMDMAEAGGLNLNELVDEIDRWRDEDREPEPLPTCRELALAAFRRYGTNAYCKPGTVWTLESSRIYEELCNAARNGSPCPSS